MKTIELNEQEARFIEDMLWLASQDDLIDKTSEKIINQLLVKLQRE